MITHDTEMSSPKRTGTNVAVSPFGPLGRAQPPTEFGPLTVKPADEYPEPRSRSARAASRDGNGTPRTMATLSEIAAAAAAPPDWLTKTPAKRGEPWMYPGLPDRES